ncbi:MAG: hypothetical protein HC828_09920 [Blastochloris sp.]|nr:hypothetical protein [Blastochloris sp.]
MTTTMTLDQVRDLVNQLPLRDQARIATEIAQRIEHALEPEPAPTAPRGSPQAILDAVKRAGPWEGDDLEELLELVYATRSQVAF